MWKNIVGLGALMLITSEVGAAAAKKTPGKRPAASVAKAPAKPVDLNVAALNLIADAIRGPSQPVDMFASKAAAAPAEGRAFTFKIKFEPSEYQPDGEPSYNYKDGVLTLIFTTERVSDFLSSKFVEYRAVKISDSITRGEPYSAQNGYGAKTIVQPVYMMKNGVAFIELPKLMKSPRDANSAFLKPASYWTSVTLEPEQARAMATDATLVIQGVYRSIDGNKMGFCRSVSVEPTIAKPRSITGSNCYATARLDRVAFVRSSGEVIKEWKLSEESAEN